MIGASARGVQERGATMDGLPVAEESVVAHLEHEAARIATNKPDEAFGARLR